MMSVWRRVLAVILDPQECHGWAWIEQYIQDGKGVSLKLFSIGQVDTAGLNLVQSFSPLCFLFTLLIIVLFSLSLF